MGTIYLRTAKSRGPFAWVVQSPRGNRTSHYGRHLSSICENLHRSLLTSLHVLPRVVLSHTGFFTHDSYPSFSSMVEYRASSTTKSYKLAIEWVVTKDVCFWMVKKVSIGKDVDQNNLGAYCPPIL